MNGLTFKLPNGDTVAQHFHVTEVGEVTRKFIDCGGTLREESSVINFQLWEADDFDHRLAPQKLLDIIELAETKLGLGNHEIEVEYQGNTIEKYGLNFSNGDFHLVGKQTACLAQDACGIPQEKPRIKLSELQEDAEFL